MTEQKDATIIEPPKDPAPIAAPVPAVEEAAPAPVEAPPPPISELRMPQFIIAFLAIIYSLYFGRPFLVPLLFSIYFWMVLRPPVRFLNKRLHFPLPLASLLILVTFFLIIGAGVNILEEPAKKWIAEAPLTMQQMENKISSFKQQLKSMRQATDKIEKMTGMTGEQANKQVAVKPTSIGSRLLTGTSALLVAVFTVIVLIFFLLASGDLFLLKVVRVAPGMRNKIRAVEIANAVEQEVGRYLGAISIINMGLGIVTGLALWALKMPNPMLWGVMVFLFNYIPYVGPTISLITLAGVALMVFPTVGQALIVPAVFLAITTVEGQFLQPLIIGRHFSINPVLVFISLMFWGWIWGVVGMLIAVPVLVVFKIFCSHIEGLGHIHEFLEG